MPGRGVGRALPQATTAAIAAGAAMAFVPRLPSRWRGVWERKNHAGAPVTLLEGPVLVIAADLALVGAAAAGAPRRAVAGLCAATAAGAFGALDDLAGSASSKGLKGHLRALTRGEVTTGSVKIVGLAASGVAAARIAHGPGARRVDSLVSGLAIAGCANVANLFDLRPGRTLKVAAIAALPGFVLRRSPLAAAALGASLGVARADLSGRAMLGDTGANAVGALVGLALVDGATRRRRLAVLAAATALTLASERVSFSRVIEANPVLRRLDQWGRGVA